MYLVRTTSWLNKTGPIYHEITEGVSEFLTHPLIFKASFPVLSIKQTFTLAKVSFIFVNMLSGASFIGLRTVIDYGSLTFNQTRLRIGEKPALSLPPFSKKSLNAP